VNISFVNEQLLNTPFSKEIYGKETGTIGGVYFTRREIDTIACIINGRTVKKIGSLLSISSKTAENHIRNVMLKLKCNSQENIRDFIENSDKYLMVKQHYLALILHFSFEEVLKEIKVLSNKKNINCIITCEKKKDNILLLHHLKDHLILTGINTLIIDNKKKKRVDSFSPSKNVENNYAIYMVYGKQIEGLIKDIETLEKTIFILIDKNHSIQFLKNMFSNLIIIDLNEQQNYFFFVLEILKEILSDISLEQITTHFKQQFSNIENASENKISSVRPKILHKIIPISDTLIRRPKNRETYLFRLGVLLLIVILCTLYLLFRQEKTIDSNQSQVMDAIRSDFSLPRQEYFLQRPYLVSQIENILKKDGNMDTISFVGVAGIGGAGKTTLAREYARTHFSSVIWEINAETKESLINSFKDLSYALAKTKEQKDELVFIQQIQNTEERDNQLFSFVKSNLILHKDWLLIYDNVDNFSNIKDFLPHDPTIWGTGKVILTTRDSNIETSSYIKPDSVIHIAELSHDEAFVLFCKIVYNINPAKLVEEQKTKAIVLLANIPPFPLDVLMAAYYIKNSQITFEQYLTKISQCSKNFEESQANFIQEINDYSKTRYGIIISSLQKIIRKHQQFKKLLFCISLFESQCIPKELLEYVDKNSFVDNFIYNLKKNGLITNELHMEKNKILPVFSLHRSTQKISLDFILNLLTEKEKALFLKGLISSIKHYYEKYAKKNYKNIVYLTPHLESLLNKLEKININKGIKEQYKTELLLILGHCHYYSTRNVKLAKNYYIMPIKMKLLLKLSLMTL
jgi:DNA-binding CsgD family transcriptional regulator